MLCYFYDFVGKGIWVGWDRVGEDYIDRFVIKVIWSVVVRRCGYYI